jgi:hypothetical protein
MQFGHSNESNLQIKSHNNKIQFSRKEIKPTQTQNKIHPRTINKVSTKSVSHLEKGK